MKKHLLMKKTTTFHPASFTKIIWIFLVLLTLFAFLLGWLKLVNHLLVGILLFTTFVKGQLVIDYFMELRNVALKWRMIPSIWLFIIISTISLCYYFPASS